MTEHSLIDADPLWVPLLTHYRSDGRIDANRMTEHLSQVVSNVSQIMLAGSTGDGWEAGDARFADLLGFAAERIPASVRIMFGALTADTDSVISRISLIEAFVDQDAALKRRYAGVTVCPPIDAEATQKQILTHYRNILDATTSPISVYQLPQVTGCVIEPETFQALAQNPRVIMFKDSSGADKVARSGRQFRQTIMLRGAEGGYIDAVTQDGYGGWLLSTANGFGDILREIETLIRTGQMTQARSLSDRLSDVVGRLFKAAQSEGGANAFSNSNRAVDHLRAYGKRWKTEDMPLKQNGKPLSSTLVSDAAEICAALLDLAGDGYLRA